MTIFHNNNNNDNNNHDVDDKNVGILAMEVYTPRTYVKQSALEEHSGIPAGKYTIGLGQEALGITGDAEDCNSICLTAVQGLLEKYDIDPKSVGRLEVGTETLVDKSKSTKTVLMDLFAASGNTDVEGATVVNACYGGTAALLNAFLWCESSGWDGRYAIVVAGDIAAYAKGPARPTSGVGAVAFLVGRDAPLAFAPPLRATHAVHEWDFFKPNPAVEYPTVDGALSQSCYYKALEDVYQRFCQKVAAPANFHAATPDYWVFHSPYNKLVQKSYARLFLLDARRRQAAKKADGGEQQAEEKKERSYDDEEDDASSSPLAPWLDKPLTETYSDKALEKALKQVSQADYQQRLTDSNAASIRVGNTYAASVFLGLASLVDRADLTPGQSICVFSYGSGALATLYCLKVRNPTTNHQFTCAKMSKAMQLTARLDAREEVHPGELDYALETRARMHKAGAPYSPVYPSDRLFPGTYYLSGIDEQWRRTYSRVPVAGAPALSSNGDKKKTHVPLAPPSVLQLEAAEQNVKQDDAKPAKRPIACVITGTAAGLPGRPQVFGPDNMNRLLTGDQCIAPLSPEVKAAMLEKNVVQLVKKADKSIEKVKVDSEETVVKLAAQLGSFDLTESYGVPAGLAQTMDVAAQVAVAAGMEALKDAGLVSGATNAADDWKVPAHLRDGTGVVYASSFPAMDAAVGEVMKFLQSQQTADAQRLVTTLRKRMLEQQKVEKLPAEDEAAFARLESSCAANAAAPAVAEYQFDRKFLFRVLVLGNAQLAQLAGCRGPNTQTNAACAGTTQAIAMAQDMLVSGRADRVVVVAGDNASGDVLMPWLGSGFRALGAATTQAAVENAALPFDKRRSGLLLGAGGIGMVLESEQSLLSRQGPSAIAPKARLLHTQYSNSAFHGAALDRNHIGSELKRFLNDVQELHGITKAEICTHGVYFSHETSTHATSATSCAGNEIAALRMAIDNDALLSKLRILNTKGFTGHPMGVSFEDVTAVQVLLEQRVPPLVNYQEPDEYLKPQSLHLQAEGGPYPCRYALRFAAGFGSQVAFALYATAEALQEK